MHEPRRHVIRKAIRNIILTRPSCLEKMLPRAYRRVSSVRQLQLSDDYFIAIAESAIDGSLTINPVSLILLSMFKLRQAQKEASIYARKLLLALWTISGGTAEPPFWDDSDHSSLFQDLLLLRIEERFQFFCDGCSRIEILGHADDIRTMLAFLTTILSSTVLSKETDVGSRVFRVCMQHLFYLTNKLRKEYEGEVARLWHALGYWPHHAGLIVPHLVQFVLDFRDAFLFESLIWVLRVAWNHASELFNDNVISTLMKSIHPANSFLSAYRLVETAVSATALECSGIAWHDSDLEIFASSQTSFGAPQSAGNVLFWVIARVYPCYEMSLRQHFPALLHMALILMDAYVPLTRRCAQEIFSSVCRSAARCCSQSEAEDFSALLMASTTRSNSAHTTPRSGAEIETSELQEMVSKAASSLFRLDPALPNVWVQYALQWATSCPVKDLAIRSWHVLQALMGHCDAALMKHTLAEAIDFLARLCHPRHLTLGSSNLGLITNIIATLHKLVLAAKLDQDSLVKIYQTFVVLLHLDIPEVFVSAAEALPPVLYLHAQAASRPTKVGSFALPAVLLKGFLLDGLAEHCHNLCLALISQPKDSLVISDDDGVALVVAFGQLLFSLEASPEDGVAEAAVNLAAVFSRPDDSAQDFKEFGTLALSLAHQRFRSARDLYVNLARCMATLPFVKRAPMLCTFWAAMMRSCSVGQTRVLPDWLLGMLQFLTLWLPMMLKEMARACHDGALETSQSSEEEEESRVLEVARDGSELTRGLKLLVAETTHLLLGSERVRHLEEAHTAILEAIGEAARSELSGFFSLDCNTLTFTPISGNVPLAVHHVLSSLSHGADANKNGH